MARTCLYMNMKSIIYLRLQLQYLQPVFDYSLVPGAVGQRSERERSAVVRDQSGLPPSEN